MKTFSLALTLLLLAVLSPLSAVSQGTAFNYQGHLNVSNSPANGTYQMQFTLYPSNSGGSSTFGPVTNTAVAVTNGIFTTTIDFGLNAFTGNASWLDIAVRTNLPASFTELTPRQQILPVPYAIFAAGASNAVNAITANTAGSASTAGSATTAGTAAVANSVAAGAINGSSIAAGTLTIADFASGQLVTNVNGLSGGVNVAVTNNLTLTTNGNTLTFGNGGDYLYMYLNLASSTESVSAGFEIPITAYSTNGWIWNGSLSQPAWEVPETGTYLIHIDGSLSTGSPVVGVEYGNTSYTPIVGSYSYSNAGTQMSHTFITHLTAGYVLYFANLSGSTIQFAVAGSTAETVFSASIIRIN